MGTVSTCCDRARVKIRDKNARQFTDADLLGMINDILEDIYQTLVNMNSNLVYATGTVTTTADKGEYTPSFESDGFLSDGSWVDGEDIYLQQVSEADKIKWDYDSTTNQPEAFYVTEDEKIGYLWVPDDAYTIHHTFWEPLIELDDYDNDDLPWLVWNRVVQRRLVVEMLEVLELDNSRHLGFLVIEEEKAMAMTYARGVRKTRQASDMFSVEGI